MSVSEKGSLITNGYFFDSPSIYVGIERSFPEDSKNVSFVDMGLA